MIRSRCRLGLAAVWILLPHGYAQSHVYAVRDDIAMVRFNDPSASARDATAKFSPDEKYFAIITSKGVITSDQIESTLSIFRSADSEVYLSASDGPENAPAPWASITLAAELTGQQAEPYGSVITELRWSPDSQSVYFLAENQHARHRVYRLDVHSRKAIALTPEDLNVIRFDFANGVIVCSAWRVDKDGQAVWEDIGDRINLDARAVTGESLKGILFPNSQPIPTVRELWTVHEDDERIVPAPVAGSRMRDISWLPEAFAISPRGHFLVQLEPLSEIPDGWSRYEPAKGSDWLRFRIGDTTTVAANSLWRPKEYSLIDLKDGSDVPLVSAPHAYALGYVHSSKAIWSSDERRVLLTNTFLPLDGVDGADREKRLQPCAVTDVELPSRESHCVIFMSDLAAGGAGMISDDGLSFGTNDDEISLKIKHPAGLDEERRYIFKTGRWRLLETKTYPTRKQDNGIPNNNSLRVGVRQGLNEPPTLWVTNTLSGQSKRLWDPNPQFANLELGQASVFRWKDKTGNEWKGGLVRPVGYALGKRYPLVIQIYNFDENLFLTDGLFPTAMVARPLASVGIVALQIQRKIPHTFDMAESDAQLAGIESAIDQLANDGLVDPDKVGLVGFSATCWYVENALIMDPTRFRAATIADGSDISYMQYHLFGVSSQSVQKEYETIIGAKPIGVAGLQQWLEKAPGFSLDRIVSPVRMEAISPSSVLSEWELYSSLKMQGKPVDLIYFPTGQHIHQKPLERLESQQGDVDWFRFWLQGYKDPDPAKRDQYQRWESMSQLQFRMRNNGR